MGSHLVIESVASEEMLRSVAVAEDVAFVESFANADRRCEVLAWRAIVRRELGEGVRIFYDEYGAPKVELPDTYISVSHSRGTVAVLFADRTCAVDIEQTNRDFRRVANRYLSQSEQMLAEQYDIFAEMWCAKEALYKYYSKGSLDLVRDISIVEYNAETGMLIATILGGAPIDVTVKREGNLVIALID
jgi:phosphopantetheinyl transferase